MENASVDQQQATMKTYLTGLGILLFVGHLFICRGGVILQDEFTGASVFNYPTPPFGQSFTAEDSFIESIGVGLQVFSPVSPDNSPNDRTVSMTLYEGTSLALQTQLGSRTVVPNGGARSEVFWVDFDFSKIRLSTGQKYTFTLQATSGYWGAQENRFLQLQNHSDYPGGDLLIGSGGFYPLADLRFRVIPVPEPSMWSLLGIGSALFISAKLRRRRTQV